ncbi:serine protease [Catellatospora sp. NPDC049133]|uniref:S1 family peptidase n=1 Tax=Catellatospora sp. NPDC049133 TaxID=3155499 RepID=UPI0033E2BF43
MSPDGPSILGTCFSVGPNIFATANHVIGGDRSNIVLVKARADNPGDYQDLSPGPIEYMDADVAEVNPFRDLCTLRIREGRIDAYVLGSSDDLLPGERFVTAGFPHADTHRFVLTRFDSTVGARVRMENSAIKSKYLVINSTSRPGQSGSPIIDPRSGRVAAVLLGAYTPNSRYQIKFLGSDISTQHQTTHAVSAEYLQEMI